MSTGSRSLEDEEDILTENILTGLLLFLGILSIFASIVLGAYSAVVVIYSRQFLTEFLKTLLFTALLFTTGLGSLYFFRKRRRQRRKTSPFFET